MTSTHTHVRTHSHAHARAQESHLISMKSSWPIRTLTRHSATSPTSTTLFRRTVKSALHLSAIRSNVASERVSSSSVNPLPLADPSPRPMSKKASPWPSVILNCTWSHNSASSGSVGSRKAYYRGRRSATTGQTPGTSTIEAQNGLMHVHTHARTHTHTLLLN